VNWIVYSLKGQAPSYNLGLLRNLQMLPLFYPAEQWRALVVTNFDSIPYSTIQGLAVDEGATSHLCIDVRETFFRDTPCHFWRFAALKLPMIVNDPDAIVLFRDADSRPSEREFQCVSAWQRQSVAFHTIKDHPLHTGTAMGGLLGIRVQKARELGFLDTLFSTLPAWLQNAPDSSRKWPDKGEVSDQDFMDVCIWPTFWPHLWVDDFRAKAVTEPAVGRAKPPFDGPFIGERVLLDKFDRDCPEPEARRLRAESFK
jgi:hypothetical protein